MFPGQLYVATSRVGTPDAICFAVKKAQPGCRPFLTCNVVVVEILLQQDNIMPMVSNEPMVTPLTAASIEVPDVDTPMDTNYEHPYTGVPVDEERDECEGGPNPAPAGHRWTRLQDHTDPWSQSDISNPLPHPRDYRPEIHGPYIDPPLSTYELIREANIEVIAVSGAGEDLGVEL